MFLKLYNILWKTALPLLKQNPRLRVGFTRRIFFNHLRKTDIWIQAASAGEAYLAVQLAQNFSFLKATRILFTTTTSQGMDILMKGIKPSAVDPNLLFQITWFPFDAPMLMQEAVSITRPDLMVLIETEIWPAHLHALKKKGTTILLINGRLSIASAKRYALTKKFWEKLRPDKILAISKQDAARFEKIFDNTKIETMNNMKFDAIPVFFGNSMEQAEGSYCGISHDVSASGLAKIVNPGIPLSILASIRMEEENDVLFILMDILKKFPDQVVAIFPRHMHRIISWEKKLQNNRIKWQLRSQTKKITEKSSVILWDTFGELRQAYPMALTAFVGGSLKPLGGQNFIEPLGFGVATVTGPHVDNFNWVGDGFFKKGLVTKAESREGVAAFMVDHLKNPVDKKTLIKKADEYIKKHRGGTATAIRNIQNIMDLKEKDC